MNSESKTRNRELSSGLLRQRRNLLISSVATFIFIALGFELTELRFLGNVAKVNNPHTVPVLLFITQLYFSLRYWQYYLEENTIPKVFYILIKNIREYERNFLTYKATSLLKKSFQFEHVNWSYPRYDQLTWGDPYETVPDKGINIFYKSVCVRAQVYSKDRLDVFEEIDDEYTFRDEYSDQKSWIIIDKSEDHRESSSGVIIEGWVTCSRLCFHWFKLKAVVKYIFKQSYFTDYQLPLALSFLSLIFGCISYINLQEFWILNMLINLVKSQ